MYKYLSFLCLCVALLGCSEEGAKQTADGQASADSLAQPMRVTEVMGIAIIEPNDRIVNLAAEQSGYIRSIQVKIGEVVKKNQVLLVLDGAVEAAQVAQASSKTATQQDVVSAARENL